MRSSRALGGRLAAIGQDATENSEVAVGLAELADGPRELVGNLDLVNRVDGSADIINHGLQSEAIAEVETLSRPSFQVGVAPLGVLVILHHLSNQRLIIVENESENQLGLAEVELSFDFEILLIALEFFGAAVENARTELELGHAKDSGVQRLDGRRLHCSWQVLFSRHDV